MKHFSIWQWADFVRDLDVDASRSAMEAHLSAGCPRCQRIVNVLHGVAVTARGESAYEPPEHAMRYAQAIYSLQGPEQASFPRLVARLLQDSVRAPLPAGIRAQNSASRHALFEAGNYYLDLQLEHQPASGLISLTGQLADRTQPQASTGKLPVWLKERNRLVATTVCSRFGEFQLEYTPAGNLRLHLPLPAVGKRLEVSLNRLNPAAPGRPRPKKIARRKSLPVRD